RRHTRFSRDWSSDVCSSDLKRLIGNDRVLSCEFLSRHPLITMPHGAGPTRMLEYWLTANGLEATSRMTCNNLSAVASLIAAGLRSEERRVGKAGRSSADPGS